MQQALEIESRETLKYLQKQLRQAEHRIAEIDRLYLKSYEDNANGKLMDERFQIVSDQLETERAELLKKSSQMQAQIDKQTENADNLNRFVDLVKAHINDDGLNGYNLHELIQGIYIENCDAYVDEKADSAAESVPDADETGEAVVYAKTAKSSASKLHRIRKIHIKYDFVGFIPIKSLMQYAEDAEKHEAQEIPA